MKKYIITTFIATTFVLFACNSANTSETTSEETTTEETVSDIIDNDTTIQNELKDADKELEEMMKADEENAAK